MIRPARYFVSMTATPAGPAATWGAAGSKRADEPYAEGEARERQHAQPAHEERNRDRPRLKRPQGCARDDQDEGACEIDERASTPVRHGGQPARPLGGISGEL